MDLNLRGMTACSSILEEGDYGHQGVAILENLRPLLWEILPPAGCEERFHRNAWSSSRDTRADGGNRPK
jgi:hypothetical protein